MNATLKYILTKFDINPSQAQPIQIPSIGRSGLAQLFAELGYLNGAEIGVDRGLFSEVLCRANPNLKLYSIDPWSTSAFEDPRNSSSAMQKQYEDHYQSALRRLSSYNCEVIRNKSLSALKKFPDNSLDFVYIDANHNFVNIAEDLYRWATKVRPGGIISGHDYQHFPLEKDNHVKHVVDAYVAAFEINPYFELGIDRYHSWFFVKE